MHVKGQCARDHGGGYEARWIMGQMVRRVVEMSVRPARGPAAGAARARSTVHVRYGPARVRVSPLGAAGRYWDLYERLGIGAPTPLAIDVKV